MVLEILVIYGGSTEGGSKDTFPKGEVTARRPQTIAILRHFVIVNKLYGLNQRSKLGNRLHNA